MTKNLNSYQKYTVSDGIIELLDAIDNHVFDNFSNDQTGNYDISIINKK